MAKTLKKLPQWIEENVPKELVSDSTLFKFKVPLPATGTKVEVDILYDLDLDYEILEEQMQDLPAQYAFYATFYSELRMMVARAERNLKARRGEAIRFITDQATERRTKLSVDSIKQIVEADAKLGVADDRLAKAQMLAGKMYHMLEALKMKAELARSLAGFKRQEQDKS